MSDNDTLKIFGMNIRQIRKKLRMTQTEFADKLNVSRGALSFYENGERDMGLYTFYMICKEFQINPSDILMIGNEIQHIALSSVSERLNYISNEIDKIKSEVDDFLNDGGD